MVPKKLKDDAIIEAACQLQFTSSELPEVLLGRLSDIPEAASFKQKRTQFADIPASVRKMDRNLAMQPLLQLVHNDGRLVQVGEGVFAAHVVGPGKYPGWDKFKPQLTAVFHHLFDRIKKVQVHNVTLRYINALVPERHLVDGPLGLEFGVTVGNEKFKGPINVSFVERHHDRHAVTTRIADIAFVQGNLPKGTAAVVDIEVSTANRFNAQDLTTVMDWIETAHTLEKAAFFRLLPEGVKSKLTEE